MSCTPTINRTYLYNIVIERNKYMLVMPLETLKIEIQTCLRRQKLHMGLHNFLKKALWCLYYQVRYYIVSSSRIQRG
jgi:hypothetical protein